MEKFEKAQRLKQLPPYLFKEIDRKKAEVKAKGVDIIDLGVGDPDLPTPEHIIGEMKRAVDDAANHQYPSYSGMSDFKEAVAWWYGERFKVALDPATEVVSLIGSKEGHRPSPPGLYQPWGCFPGAQPGVPGLQHRDPFCGWGMPRDAAAQ